MSAMKELWEEANDAFYEWEEQSERTDLSDRDRLIWIEAYAVGKLKGVDNEFTKR